MNSFVAGPVFQNGDASFLARVEIDGVVAQKSDIATITCNVYDLKGDTPTTPVLTPTLTVAATMFDTLQTDGRWTRDTSGYNFRHAMPNTAFTHARHEYDVVYQFTSSTSKVAFAKFRVTAEGTSY